MPLCKGTCVPVLKIRGGCAPALHPRSGVPAPPEALFPELGGRGQTRPRSQGRFLSLNHLFRFHAGNHCCPLRLLRQHIISLQPFYAFVPRCYDPPNLMVELQTRDSALEFFQNFSSSFLGCAIIFQKATFSRRVELDYWCNALRTLLMFGIVVT